MFLHKSFRVLPPNTSGIPVHSIECYYKSPSDFQFDWIKAYDDTPIQICALVELRISGNTNRSIFMFSGIICDYVNGINGGVSPPFPMIKYRMIYLPRKGNTRYPALTTDVVDEITEPSFVVPVNVASEHFIIKDVKCMIDAKFLILPMQFLLRDGYASMDFTIQLNTALQTDKKTNEFLQETTQGKKTMYKALINTLYKNTDTQYIADDLIYQQLIRRDDTPAQTDDI